MSRGIKVEADGDIVKIEINIIVRYGVNIREVGRTFKLKLKKK
ncbi:MAG: Asp23/Gls24 family envelope stress response protein [Clostridium saudiense]